MARKIVRRLSRALQPDQVTGIVDTREKTPLPLAPIREIRKTLGVGDYSVLGLEQIVCVERKSLPDLLACVGTHRRRFERTVHRMLAFPARLLVVEATWDDLEAARWRSQITARQAIGSCQGWMLAGLPIVMAGNRQRAAPFVSRFLFLAARQRWRESYEFASECLDEKLAMNGSPCSGDSPADNGSTF